MRDRWIWIVVLTLGVVPVSADERPPFSEVLMEVGHAATFAIENEELGGEIYTTILVTAPDGWEASLLFVRPDDGWQPSVHLAIEPGHTALTYIPSVSCPSGYESKLICDWEEGVRSLDFPYECVTELSTTFLCYSCEEKCVPAPPGPHCSNELEIIERQTILDIHNSYRDCP